MHRGHSKPYAGANASADLCAYIKPDKCPDGSAHDSTDAGADACANASTNTITDCKSNNEPHAEPDAASVHRRQPWLRQGTRWCMLPN